MVKHHGVNDETWHTLVTIAVLMHFANVEPLCLVSFVSLFILKRPTLFMALGTWLTALQCQSEDEKTDTLRGSSVPVYFIAAGSSYNLCFPLNQHQRTVELNHV